MTEYLCEICNYKTNRKSNITAHIKTIKHIDNMKHSGLTSNERQSNVSNMSVTSQSSASLEHTNQNIKNQFMSNDINNTIDAKYNVIKQSKHQNNKISNVCDKCNIQFSHRQTLFNHKKSNRCKYKKEEISVNDKEDKNIIVELFKEQMKIMQERMEKMEEERKEERKEQNRRMEEENRRKEEENRRKEEERKEQNRRMEEERKEHMKILYKFMDSTSDLTTKSLSTVNFIIAHFTNSPLLEPIKDYEKFLLDNKERERLEANLVYQFKEGSLIKYIGDLIVATYKKDKPCNQSMWTSDVSRLTYVVNTVVSNVSGWHVDKGGIIIKEKIVQPIMDFMLDTLIEYYNKITADFNKKKYIGDRDYMLHHIDECNDLTKYIESGKLCRDIIRYIAPHFHLNKTIRDEESNKKYIEYNESSESSESDSNSEDE
jgi:hypothetical protein